MKKIIFSLMMALAMLTTKSVLAQGGPGGQMQQMQRQFLKDSVHLSDIMVDSVMAVRMQYQPQMHEVFRDQSMSDSAKQTKLEGMRSEMYTRFKAIGLTDDQIKMIRDHDQRMREQMRNRMNNGGGGQ